MKYLLFLLVSLALLLISCDKNANGSSYSKTVDFPINPCDFISRKMIVCHFGISSSKLDFIENNNSSNSVYSECGYEWPKSNFEEIQENRTTAMLSYASLNSGNVGENSENLQVSDLISLESPNNHVKIGHFKKYQNVKSAKREFYNSRTSISESEHEKLREKDLNRIEKATDFEILEAIANDANDKSQHKIKYTEIEGCGDKAFYNHKLKSLDVLFGTLSFSVFIDTEFDIETDILIAKKIAYYVWGEL